MRAVIRWWSHLFLLDFFCFLLLSFFFEIDPYYVSLGWAGTHYTEAGLKLGLILLFLPPVTLGSQVRANTPSLAISHFFLCVSMSVVHVHTLWRPEDQVSWSTILPVFLRDVVFHWIWASLEASRPCWASCLHPTWLYTCGAFSVGARKLNSAPHVCASSILLPEPFLNHFSRSTFCFIREVKSFGGGLWKHFIIRVLFIGIWELFFSLLLIRKGGNKSYFRMQIAPKLLINKSKLKSPDALARIKVCGLAVVSTRPG